MNHLYCIADGSAIFLSYGSKEWKVDQRSPSAKENNSGHCWWKKRPAFPKENDIYIYHLGKDYNFHNPSYKL